MQLKQTRTALRGVHLAPLALALGLVLAAPAAMAEMYAWRTDDGGYAYTDDLDQVPARYKDRVTVVGTKKLEDYERFTPQDSAASDRYAERLAERLAHLREVNAPQLRAAAPATVAAMVPERTLSLATGDEEAPRIDVPIEQGAGPVVVEPVQAKRSGDIRTRRVTVIRQGGETLAVIKSDPQQFDLADDIHDEEDIEAGAPLR